MTFAPEVWDGVLCRLESELPDFTYEAWVAPLVAKPHERGLLLLCPNSFHRERVRKHLLGNIHRCLRDLAGRSIEVELGVSELPTQPRGTPPRKCGPRAAAVATKRHAMPINRRESPGVPNSRSAASPRRSPTSHPAAPEPEPESTPDLYRFDNFVVGPCNALAREASLALARGRQLSQLYLRAESGMGKTHLSRAAAAEGRVHHPGQVRYAAAETFTNQFMAALSSKKTEAFKRRYRNGCRLLVLEDLQFLERKTATQLEFFHTLQHVMDSGGRVLLTGDRMPSEMTGLDKRIRSQLQSGFVAEIEPPDAQVRRAILRDKAARGGVRLPPDCLDLLVESVRGSVRQLEGVLIQLVTTASLLKRPIDLELTRGAVDKKVAAANVHARTLGVSSVIRVVAGFFRTTPEKMASRSRRKDVLLPRQLAMYLCHRHTDASLAEIGRALDRDHPSVRGAIRKIERQMLERAPLRYQLEAITDRLELAQRGAGEQRNS